MANGFSLGLLQMQNEVHKAASPQYKIEPYGLLASLYTAHSRGAIKNNSFDGHTQTVKVKAKKRVVPGDTSDSASCENTNTIPYVEDTVSVANYRQYAFHIEDETIAQFDAYASQNVRVPGSAPATDLMFEFYDSLMTAASGILTAVNRDLWTLALAAIGNNRRTGTNTATNLNFTQNTALNVLTAGANQIKRDFAYNSMTGRPIAVGAGLFHNWILQQPAATPTQGGIDSRIQAAGFDFFHDEDLDIQVGASNKLVVYEKDAIQIVEYMKYKGFKAGAKGTSVFGTMMLPMNAGGGQMIPVEFDYQLKYNDCDQEFAYVDGSSAVTLEKGWNLIVSKNFGLYTIPATAYDASDVLTGNRGSLYYTITNT